MKQMLSSHYAEVSIPAPEDLGRRGFLNIQIHMPGEGSWQDTCSGEASKTGKSGVNEKWSGRGWHFGWRDGAVGGTQRLEHARNFTQSLLGRLFFLVLCLGGYSMQCELRELGCIQPEGCMCMCVCVVMPNLLKKKWGATEVP